MMQGSDTLPYKTKIIIQTDTVYFGANVYYPGDTLYEGTCQTFEKINGQIVNQSDEQCLRQNLWIIADSLDNYRTGNYHNNHEVGIWKWFDKDGKLLKETEKVSLGKDTYTVKEIDYSSGRPVTIVDRDFFAFYIKNFFIIISIVFGALFTRPFINSKIYNREYGTNLSPLYFGLPFTKKYSEYALHSLMCVFTIWFINYKPENKRLVIISNILSLLALVTFFGLLIGLAINGELH